MDPQGYASMNGVTQPSESQPPSENLASIITNALQQQASQFEAIIGGLQTQVNNLMIAGGKVASPKTSTSAKKKNNQETSASRNMASTPSSKKGPRTSNPGPTSKTPQGPQTPKTPKTPKTPTPIRKRHPLQLHLTDLPKDFKTTKEALFVHIKMMWGLFKPNDVPPSPDPVLLQEFYLRFSSNNEIEAILDNPSSTDIIAAESILTLREARVGRSKLGRGVLNLDQVHILYIHGVLAKVGIRVWGPDLNDSPDSLFNSACRITALNTFRQLVAAGAYNYMNVQLKYANAMSMMISAYNHYVHYLTAEKFKTETKEAGRVAKQNTKKTNQKNRERLRDVRHEFLLKHRSKYPSRYRRVVEDVLAHSDDEFDASKGIYVIKTLGYRSQNASKFFRRLDVEILKEAEVAGKTPRKRIRKLPKVPVPSAFNKAPKNMPIDFYSPAWFRQLQPAQKRLTADVDAVAFLPDASQSLLPDRSRHPDEKLGDKSFVSKYLDIVSEAYEISEDEDIEDDSDEKDEVSEQESIEIEDDSGKASEEDEESDFYSEGNFGDLYDREEDDGEEKEEEDEGNGIDIEEDI